MYKLMNRKNLFRVMPLLPMLAFGLMATTGFPSDLYNCLFSILAHPENIKTEGGCIGACNIAKGEHPLSCLPISDCTGACGNTQIIYK
jgi:hypothetical protein